MLKGRPRKTSQLRMYMPQCSRSARHVELEEQVAGGSFMRSSSPTFQALTMRRRESGCFADLSITPASAGRRPGLRPPSGSAAGQLRHWEP